MFIHSTKAKARAITLVLLLPVSFFVWLLFRILQETTFSRLTAGGWLLLGFMSIAVVLFIVALLLLWIAPYPTEPDLTKTENWTEPNRIPRKTLVTNVFFSIALPVYLAASLHLDIFYLPSKKGVVQLQGAAAWLMCGALACVIANLVSVVVDHFDRRNNEFLYVHFLAITQWLGWTFFVAALVKNVLNKL